MDALSQILDDIHLSKAEYVYVMAEQPWQFECSGAGFTAFHIVLMGQVQIVIDHESYVLNSGDMALIPSGRQHRLGFDAKSEHIKAPTLSLDREFRGHRHDPVICYRHRADTLILSVRCALDAEMAKPLLNALPNLMVIRGLTDQGAPDWLKVGLQFLALETERNRPGRDTLLNRLVGMLFIECVRDHVEQLPQDSESWLYALADPQLSPVLTAIHAMPERPWTVADLAGLACMSRSSFAEHFSRVIGQPPLGYLLALRLRLAARNLREHRHSIARISEMVGYGSETAFSQAFKRQYHQSPRQYRQQHQQD